MPAQRAFLGAAGVLGRNPACRSALWWVSCTVPQLGAASLVGVTMKRIPIPSPALVIAGVALFVALGGVAYAAATIDSADIVDGSIRNRDFKDGTLRGNEAKRNGFGGGAIKETTLDASQLDADDIGKVANAGAADGLTRQAVVTATGTLSRNRGTTSAARTGEGQYQVVFNADVKACAYAATLGDPADGAPPAGEIAASSLAGNANGVLVVTRDSTGAATADRPFHLIVSC
jgi:hypothetical protein